MPQDQSIAVFDSGAGGLTVLKSLADKFPNENFIYLGDTARLPYGSKSPDTIRRYTEQCLKFLAQRNVKALVIACNSASSQFPENNFAGVPVETVILPGAQSALAATEGKIGILGTRATISSQVYEKTLTELAKIQQRKVEIYSNAAPLFVPLAEEGWTDDPITNLIAYRYVQPLIQQGVDTIILGCTHYPILRTAIQRASGNAVQLVDSGNTLANSLDQKFKAGQITQRTTAHKRSITILTTDQSALLSKMAELLLSPHAVDHFEVVDL